MHTNRSFLASRPAAAAISVLLAAVAASISVQPARAATTFIVTRTGDGSDINFADNRCDVLPDPGDQCTLRAAIQQANATAGADTIRFNITTPGRVITPSVPFAAITEQLTINAYSQPGTSTNTQAVGSNAVLGIVLDGVNAGAGANGLTFDASDSIVRGLIIQRWDGAGILVNGDRNQVIGNFIGTNFNGTTARGNDIGVKITGADNIVGGTHPGLRNLISGNTGTNGDGVLIADEAAAGNRVQGNYIGVNASGTAALGNERGVRVFRAPNTLIGGFLAAARNVISGNADAGVRIDGEGTLSSIQGNYIGTDANGAAAIANLRGVYVQGDDVSIGGTARNVISGNLQEGVWLHSSSQVTVAGNFIGTDAAGTADLGNAEFGLRINGSNNTIGGTTASVRNVISGNGAEGVEIVGFDNILQGNFIGTDVTGTLGLGNDQSGIQMYHRSVIGGAVAGAGNVISDNGVDGIRIGPPGDNSTDIVIQGNRIGTKADGTGDLGNVENGVNIFGHDNTVGGPGNAANLISGNNGNGVRIASGFATGNVVTGNVIRANAARGARIEFGPNNLSGNVFITNGSDGVVVLTSAKGVDIIANQIFGNGGLGINLSEGTPIGGVTLNDTDDPDTGANDRQNFPVINSAVRDQSQGFTTVMVSLNSNPSTEFRVDVFLAQADPSGHGEGQFLIHTQTVTTNAGGDVNFAFASGALFAGHVLTSTAINTANRNTSEFSQNRTVTAVP